MEYNKYKTLTQNFALKMQDICFKNRHKIGWQRLSNINILQKIKEETTEIETALLNQKSTKEIIDECVDVANFCMMLADNLKRREE